MNLDEPRFTMKAVATAIGGPAHVNTIQSWFQRGHFKIGETDLRAEPGLGHAISLRTALQVGVAWHLYQRADLHPKKGAEIAKAFTHYGTADRDPGELFRGDDFTVLAVFPELGFGRVINATEKSAMLDAFNADEFGRQYAVTLLSLNQIDRDLRVALLQDGKGSSQ